MMERLVWEKRGRIFQPQLMTNWRYQYSQVPWAIELDDVVRVYFTSRPPSDQNGQYVSYTFYADFDKNDLTKVVNLKQRPVMSLGDLGHFDEFGTMPCSVVKREDHHETWLYYVGWNRKFSVPYDCAIGLAKSKDNGDTFTRFSKGPLIGASPTNPFLIGCPRVYSFNRKWYMWYLGGTHWKKEGSRAESIYHLKLATSENGIDWDFVSDVVVPKKYEDECQTCASVFEYNNKFHLYFTYRHGVDFRNPERGYRIGYAYSDDLINWERDDDMAGINISSEGWDSEMICYPFITKIGKDIMMFYCGNYFGKEGFGYAVLK